ncbi:MAG: muconolactone Delta-isomerase family protein [Candidatus Tritonobacter lacicola]|nr:muconolactone Delta-isomerase family protein [Candidatus Tritonobacter lacicola]
MLYLVNCELEGAYPLPAEEWLELVVKGMEDIMKYKEQGKVVFHGALVGRQAGCTIWDVDSNEELQTLVSQLPMWPFMEWEITPLISTEQTIESVKQSLASVRALKK